MFDDQELLSSRALVMDHCHYSDCGLWPFLAQAFERRELLERGFERVAARARSVQKTDAIAADRLHLLCRNTWLNTDNEGIEVPDPKITLLISFEDIECEIYY